MLSKHVPVPLINILTTARPMAKVKRCLDSPQVIAFWYNAILNRLTIKSKVKLVHLDVNKPPPAFQSISSKMELILTSWHVFDEPDRSLILSLSGYERRFCYPRRVLGADITKTCVTVPMSGIHIKAGVCFHK